MVAQRPAIEHKSGAQVSAEQKVLLEAYRARGGGDVVQTLSPTAGGALRFITPTPGDPSPRARQLAEQLLEVKSYAEWGAVVDALTDARDVDAVATREWGRLLAAAGDLGYAQGWMGWDDWAGTHRLVQQALRSGGRG